MFIVKHRWFKGCFLTNESSLKVDWSESWKGSRHDHQNGGSWLDLVAVHLGLQVVLRTADSMPGNAPRDTRIIVPEAHRRLLNHPLKNLVFAYEDAYVRILQV